jgi:hypothetical protein
MRGVQDQPRITRITTMVVRMYRRLSCTFFILVGLDFILVTTAGPVENLQWLVRWKHWNESLSTNVSLSTDRKYLVEQRLLTGIESDCDVVVEKLL